MARDEAGPWARGETFYNGGTIDSNNLGGVNYEGREYVFEVNAPDDPTGADPSGRLIRVKVVRNSSGVALLPGRLVHYKPTDPYRTKTDGYCFAVGDVPAGIVDEFLPAAGVPANDLFYVVIAGPTKVVQPHTANTSVAIGTRLVPTAGGGSSLTDNLSGRVLGQDLTGATATLGDNIQNCIGYAAEANNTVDAKFAAIVNIGSR